MGLFSFGKKKSYGIDIGTQSIKICELLPKGDRVQLVNYAVWSNDGGEVIQEKGGNSMSPEYIAGIIKQMCKNSGIRMTEGYFAVPTFLAFSSIIQVPVMSEVELVKAVPLEARQYIPIPMSEVQIDWINLGKSVRTGKFNILLMAIPNTAIHKYTGIAKLLGINIKGFELDIFSQIRSINIKNRNTCVVDVGARSSTVSLINKRKELVMTRSFDVGGNQITNRIAEVLNLSTDRAERLKIDNGVVGDQGIAGIISNSLSQLVQQGIVKVIQDYQIEYAEEVDEVLVLGGISKMKGVLSFFENQLYKADEALKKIEVKLAIPNTKITVRKELEGIFADEIWADLSLAMGIALREFKS
jgi:type IV pilus assembly protein PilM